MDGGGAHRGFEVVVPVLVGNSTGSIGPEEVSTCMEILTFAMKTLNMKYMLPLV